MPHINASVAPSSVPHSFFLFPFSVWRFTKGHTLERLEYQVPRALIDVSRSSQGILIISCRGSYIISSKQPQTSLIYTHIVHFRPQTYTKQQDHEIVITWCFCLGPGIIACLSSVGLSVCLGSSWLNRPLWHHSYLPAAPWEQISSLVTYLCSLCSSRSTPDVKE